MKYPTIEEAAAWDDTEVAEFLGTDEKIASFRKEIDELAALTGKAKTEADRIWAERLRPFVDGDSLRWMKEDAIRSTKSAKELLADTEPSSIY